VRKLAATIHDVGSLNYAITKLLLETNPRPSYQDAVTVMGTLSCVSAEWYRRWVSPYEDMKARENGEVFLTQQRQVDHAQQY
jgi:hypothetical protein